MSHLVAFVGDVPQADREQYLIEVSSRLKDVKVVTFDNLSQYEKNEVQVAIVANPDPKQMMQLPNLVWVQSLWVGVERLIAEMPKAKFAISRMVDPVLASTMAEAVLAWVLYLHRDMPQYKHQQEQQEWKQHHVIEASDRKVSILGLGQLGLAAAKRLRLNDFSVNGWSRTQLNIEGVSCFAGDEGFKEVLKQTDILVCLLPLTPQTRNLLNQDSLELLPAGASLINFSRGHIVNDDALLTLLDKEHLSHAVLDVFTVEPLPESNPLWKSKKITILPHISAPTNISSASKIVFNNLKQYFETGKMSNVINRSQGY